MGLSDSKIQKQLQTSPILTDSPTKSKSNGNNNSSQIKTWQNMKCMIPSKRLTPDYSEMERNNIYAETPPKMKSTIVPGINHYIPILQQRRPSIPIRTDSSRSIGSTTISSLSSQSTTPSNSFRQDSTPIMIRSADASSSCGLITLMKNGTNNIKSKSTYDIETSIVNNNNNKCLNMITNGHFVPLQSVKEDECLEVNDNKYSKNGNKQQCALIDILKEKYPEQNRSSSLIVSTPMMSRNNSSHQRSSSTDDELSPGYTNGFTRNHRIRSSLPFIIKPAVNRSKSNSLGLCFLICGNETKKVLLPSYISCLDTLKALFVRAFPQHLTMKQMDTENVRIYIRELEKNIFYQLEDMKDVKDRSVLKIVQLNNNKPHVSFKQPETDEISCLKDNSEITYQRLSRFGRIPSTNNPNEEKSTSNPTDNPSRSLSEPRNRIDNKETIPIINKQPSTVLKGILTSPRSGSTTPRIDDDDARTKMALMEKQLESLTALVKELTNSQQIPPKPGLSLNFNNKSLQQQLHELKMKTHTLRNDFTSIRRMQQSLQENFKTELEDANKKIEEQFTRLNQQDNYCNIDKEVDLYTKNSTKIDRDLEDLEISVEELQNDVKSKRCYVTMNDVESFALVLSTISRSLVDLKASFPILREKLSTLDKQSTIKFLHEEPERLDYTIKKCKRLTTMLYQLKRSAIHEEHKSPKKISFCINEKSVDRKRLLEEIHSVTSNFEGRIKAIEKAEKLRERRLYYENQLENLKQMKTSPEQTTDGYSDTRSLTNSLSTRTSICSTDSNNCPSPSLSFIIRQALICPSINDSKTRLQTSIKPPSKVTFSQQLITNEKCLNKKTKPILSPRIQSTPSSSAVSSASSSSSSSCIGGNSRLTNGFCGIIPLLSPDRRHNGRCYSFSSSSTDTDSVISNSHKSPSIINSRFHQTTLMRASVTDL